MLFWIHCICTLACSSTMADASARFYGTVKSFNSEKGWGFFESAESHALYGCDIFVVRHTLLPQQMDYLIPGTPVSFCVVQGTKGMCASEVSFGPESNSAATATDGKFQGVVKSYNATKGYGFVTCPATDQQFGRDVFLIRTEVPSGNIMAGTDVAFDVFVGDRGPTAHNIIILGKASSPPAKPQAYPVAHKPQPVPAAPPRPPPAARPQTDFNQKWQQSSFEAPPMTNGEIKNFDLLFYGHVKSIDAKGSGLIASEATRQIYNADTPALRMSLELAKVNVGDHVRFTLANGPWGPMAVNISHVQEGAWNSGVMCKGIVKSYNESKGYGFVICSGDTSGFGGDVFLSRNALNGQSVQKNDEVSFTVDLSTGRAVAQNVQKGDSQEADTWGSNGSYERASPY